MSTKVKPFGNFERKIAFRYLRARKKEGGVALIAWISFTCIMLAVFAMITVMSVMNGFRSELVTRIIGAQGHAFVVTKEDYPQVQTIDNLLEWVRGQDEVDNAYSIKGNQAFVTFGKRGSGSFVKGIAGDDLRSISYMSDNIELGSLDSFDRGEDGQDDIVIGYVLARTLGATVGDRITIISPQPVSTPMGSSLRRKTYEITAIFDMGFMDADSLYIYMPMDEALLFFQQGEVSDEIELRLKNPDLIDAFERSLRANPPSPVYISTWRDRSASIATALRIEQIAMRLIFSIVVLISVFPIVSAMIMLVKNKGRDIAILRTVGATQGSILRIFLMIGTIIGVAGTAAGILLGVLFCMNIGAIQGFLENLFGIQLFDPSVYELSGGIPAKILPGEVFAVSLLGFFVAAFATFFPAWGASKLDPVEAFRNE